MDVFLWSAITVGFFGSFHCAGMCGPIAMALPSPDQPMTSLFVSRLLYNVGRVTTYTLFGAIACMLGHSFSINGWQSDISILSGIIIILFVLFNTQAVKTKINHRIYKFTSALKKSMGSFMQKKSFTSLYFIGVLNGFLPCGFVYLALAGAASSHGVLEGMSYMALFGLGTIPMMLILSLSGSFISLKARNWVQKISPVVAIVLALFLIQRGVMLKENPDACCERVEKSTAIR